MAKLTKAQQRHLQRALAHAERAHAYLMSDQIAVARKDRAATTTLHYTRSDGSTLYEVQKEYGSDLTGLADCIADLKALLSSS